MRSDLQKALNRTWNNYLLSFGIISFIEKNLSAPEFETVLYATSARILSTGHIENNQMYSYSVNQNLNGLLIITNCRALHFSRGKRVEQVSFDATSIELKKHLFWSFIHLKSEHTPFYMNVGSLSKKELNLVVNMISYSIDKQKEILNTRRKRKTTQYQ